MKTLDRYIIRSFLYSAVMWFVILMALRIVIDMAVSMDEFTKLGKPFAVLAADIASYYAYNSLMYFTELGGIIISVSAAFTLAMMNHTNELTAMMASGVSLHRVAWPIILCSLLLGGLVVFDKEVIIPRIADKLVRDKDDTPGKSDPPIRLVNDSSGAVWYSPKLRNDPRLTGGPTMETPVVIVRRHVVAGEDAMQAVARISASRAHQATVDGRKGWMFRDASLTNLATDGPAWSRSPTTDRLESTLLPEALVRTIRQTATGESQSDAPIDLGPGVLDEMYGMTIQGVLTSKPIAAESSVDHASSASVEPVEWLLSNPRFTFRGKDGQELAILVADSARWNRDEHSPSYWTLSNGRLFFASDLNSRELVLSRSSRWIEFCSTRQLLSLASLPRFRNVKAADMTRHVRATEPINILVMLLLSLPFILSRERNIKASAGLALLITGSFMAFIYICRYMGLPAIWAAWLPALLFGPVAVVMFDSVKT